MMKPGSVWGSCEYRNIGPRTGWSYICGKDGHLCDPDYCLGPDEDKLEEKGDQIEREIS